jgi:ribosome production factor 2
MHFASELFDTHPQFIQVKSLLMDFFNAEVIDSICLAGLEHVISVSLAPAPPELSHAAQDAVNGTIDPKNLPKIHLRTYTVRLLSSGTRIPRVELEPMGPFLDLTVRRHQRADPEMWKVAMKRPRLKKQDVEKGLGKKKKNLEVDEMGDLRGRLHVAKQDLGRLQTRKMKGLKKGADEENEMSGLSDEDTPKRTKR